MMMEDAASDSSDEGSFSSATVMLQAVIQSLLHSLSMNGHLLNPDAVPEQVALTIAQAPRADVFTRDFRSLIYPR